MWKAAPSPSPGTLPEGLARDSRAARPSDPGVGGQESAGPFWDGGGKGSPVSPGGRCARVTVEGAACWPWTTIPIILSPRRRDTHLPEGRWLLIPLPTPSPFWWGGGYHVRARLSGGLPSAGAWEGAAADGFASFSTPLRARAAGRRPGAALLPGLPLGAVPWRLSLWGKCGFLSSRKEFNGDALGSESQRLPGTLEAIQSNPRPLPQLKGCPGPAPFCQGGDQYGRRESGTLARPPPHLWARVAARLALLWSPVQPTGQERGRGPGRPPEPTMVEGILPSGGCGRKHPPQLGSPKISLILPPPTWPPFHVKASTQPPCRRGGAPGGTPDIAPPGSALLHHQK